jgi:lambda repressor-like predicted transcriptional regulator
LRLYAQSIVEDATLEHVSDAEEEALEHPNAPRNDFESANRFSQDICVARAIDKHDGDGECLVFDKHQINLLRQAAARYFGSWAKAVKEAGIADGIISRRSSKNWSREDVVSVLQKAYEDGRSHRAILKEEKGLDGAVRRHFGKWLVAVEAAGLKAKKRTWTRELIIAEIKQRFEKGVSLSSRAKDNAALASTGRYHFGSWTAALQAAGVLSKPRKPRCSNDS